MFGGTNFGIVLVVMGLVNLFVILSISYLIIKHIRRLRLKSFELSKSDGLRNMSMRGGNNINPANYFFGFITDAILITLLLFISTFILIQSNTINTWGNDTLHTLARYGLLLFLLSRLIARIIFKASPAEKIIRIKKINMQSILIFTICDCAIGLFILIYILNR